MTLIPITNKFIYREDDSIVRITNDNHKTFKAFKVSRSVDDVCGTFSITISRPTAGQNPFKAGQVIDIVMDGVQLMRGKIYEIAFDGDDRSDTITISGRDITGDLIDSTVPDDSKVFVEGVSLFSIASKIIISKGLVDSIRVINDTGEVIKPFDVSEIVSCATDATVIEFLLKYSRKRQLFINTSVFGDLVFFKAKGTRTGNKVTNEFKGNNNNVIKYRSKYNTSERFNRYICRSQGTDYTVNDYDNIQGQALDVRISDARELVFLMEEEALDASECRVRAEEEASVRRARAFEYEVTVQGFRDKVPWAVNQFVDVVDDKVGIRGEYYIKGVSQSLSLQKGRVTVLTITHRDAYTAQAAIDSRSSTGIEWL